MKPRVKYIQSIRVTVRSRRKAADLRMVLPIVRPDQIFRSRRQVFTPPKAKFWMLATRSG